jgi:hypothetical protein
MRQNHKKAGIKLSLSKETLKKLSTQQLEFIAGGAPTADCTVNCTGSSSVTDQCHTRGCHTHPCHH